MKNYKERNEKTNKIKMDWQFLFKCKVFSLVIIIRYWFKLLELIDRNSRFEFYNIRRTILRSDVDNTISTCA